MKEKRRESPAGFHFYSLYKKCPRKWYLKYIQGLQFRYTEPPLLFGGAMHEALAAYYKEGLELEAALTAFYNEMEERGKEYFKEERYQQDLEKGPAMLEEYDNTWREHDKKRYKILEIEKQHDVYFGPDNAFYLTVRPDRVFKDRQTGRVFPVESKTTSYSVGKMFQGTEMDDQVTSYIWALKKVHPEWNIEECLIDVLYKKGKVVRTERPGVALRTKGELTLFEMEMLGTILEITQKVRSLEELPWPLLFGCNRDHCKQYGCAYQGICRTNLKPDEVPPMFQKDEWISEMDELVKRVQDFKLEDILK